MNRLQQARDRDATIAAQAARIAELEAVVAKLPKTADGVPITPGMLMFSGESARCWAGQMRQWDERESQHEFFGWYSTRSAAEAANGGG